MFGQTHLDFGTGEISKCLQISLDIFGSVWIFFENPSTFRIKIPCITISNWQKVNRFIIFDIHVNVMYLYFHLRIVLVHIKQGENGR